MQTIMVIYDGTVFVLLMNGGINWQRNMKPSSAWKFTLNYQPIANYFAIVKQPLGQMRIRRRARFVWACLGFCLS
jgi:hypothetical protein